MMKKEKFICICGKEFKSQKSLSAHMASCKDHYLHRDGNLDNYYERESNLLTVLKSGYKISTLKCPYCDKDISKNNLSKHIVTHINGSFNKKQKEYVCICGKIFTNSQSFNGHKGRCKIHMQNKYGESYIFPDNFKNARGCGWSKGLTKDTDERVKHISESVKKAVKNCKEEGKKWSLGKAKTEEAENERRRKISETMKKNPKAGGIRKGSGRGKKGWYKGYFCDSTYELVYVIYNLDHNISFKRADISYTYTYNNQEHLYYPDFELKDGTLVEIKGYMTGQTYAKINAVKDRKLIVLQEKDLEYAFNYVKENYEYDELKDLYDKPSEVSETHN